MAKNDFKLAWRKLLKNKGFTFLNIVGLTLGFTGFILSYQYINRETSYDKWNPHFKDIYQIGLEAEGAFTDETSPSLAPLLKQNLPDIVYAGRKIVYNYGSYPLFGEKTVLIKNAALIDSSAARIFQIENATGPLYKNKDQKDATMVKSHIAEQLFKKEDLNFDSPQSIPALSLQIGMKETIYGTIKKQGLSMIDYDLLFIREPQDLFADNNPFLYQTYIQVRPGTDITKLTNRINALYQKEIAPKDKIRSSSYAKGKIYLDPLANLHLRPKTGNNTAYIITWIIGILSVLILLLASANFANMIMAQADQRLKELALKKILGSSRWAIVRQLVLEVFILTFSAAILSFVTLALTGNILQKWFNDDLKGYILSSETIAQLAIAVLLTTILSAIYPAIVLSGFKSVNLLKGGLSSILKKGTFRNALLTFQISMAILFISGMLVIRAQLNYMQQADKGFEPAQVVNFKGVGMYYNKDTYNQLKRRLENDPSIAATASATNIPGEGEQPPKMDFSYAQKTVSFAHVGIDPKYFKTLNIPSIQGNTNISIDQLLRDSLANYAIINESAAKNLGLENPMGAKIKGCDVNFEIVGLVKDSKAYGFENVVQPTIYSFKSECGSMRLQTTLMVKTKPGMVDRAIQTVKAEWEKNPSTKDLPLDYSFMDEQYALQHKKQQELQTAFNSFTSLSVIIAALGLFSMAAYQAALRKKEMSIRKVLGASVQLLFIQLNKPFFKLFLIGIGIALPIAYLLMNRWLSNFAYHIQLSWWSFLIPIFCIFILILVSISFQSIKVAKTNPIDSLRDE
ncbi:ABC transporter permease [Sphingobacterium paramultivorum]|uniref:ABC transporter permease n=1 Tax=Sphingobacterium paramultivorum TaxID=2886510 RepID=A0A7G5E559_9SPHI|nr:MULTISPECIES: ABC transporter permease [Sphingobacterium]MCS4166953.1 putative ABC transport system permease protein [Sphingobacterium sp. BIGb0116]QMV69134.1 ABC transporter permease [Sphingobacterium paramultivorum]WSO12921.1 FtsX-like permease family protein [Sphingobacterium paramultivorum]